MERPFTVGVTLKTDNEFPEGVPCILTNGDSVLCEFRGSIGKAQAAVTCDILNMNYRASQIMEILTF